MCISARRISFWKMTTITRMIEERKLSSSQLRVNSPPTWEAT